MDELGLPLPSRRSKRVCPLPCRLWSGPVFRIPYSNEAIPLPQEDVGRTLNPMSLIQCNEKMLFPCGQNSDFSPQLTTTVMNRSLPCIACGRILIPFLLQGQGDPPPPLLPHVPQCIKPCLLSSLTGNEAYLQLPIPN